jgi:hypothetical protein
MSVKNINGKRTRNLFTGDADEPYKISRTKIELFLQCPRCFYLDRKLGINRPDSPPFTLNNAVDALLKKEFDAYRGLGEPHPLMQSIGFYGVPFKHPDLARWRDNRNGVQTLHKETGFLVFGAIDDVWINESGELFVVDYKATSSELEVSLDGEWKKSYKRQAEVYQWLLRRNGFTVSDRAYFVYANGDKTKSAFDSCLHFSLKVLPYDGSDAWVPEALQEAHLCLLRDETPLATDGCPWCSYVSLASGNSSE